ncbi:hypothetical protein RHMOL_Rhmol11G0001700 [Rhododendron molle]|uniref:Uncharacterized protein n=1 Tax=Rhododendron molle TaxID=49168 RepID=A0ACC0LNS3_RHOML|nr:hypothetical protein RHMOL_Rhmol11G0001700 [Rhododendron molle]
MPDSPPSIEVSVPEWFISGEFICARLIGLSCIHLHSPIIKDFAPYSLILQNSVFRDLFYMLVRLYPKFSIGTFMSEGFINFSLILQTEESLMEEEVLTHRHCVISDSSDMGQSSRVKPLLPPACLSRGSP